MLIEYRKENMQDKKLIRQVKNAFIVKIFDRTIICIICLLSVYIFDNEYLVIFFSMLFGYVFRSLLYEIFAANSTLNFFRTGKL